MPKEKSLREDRGEVWVRKEKIPKETERHWRRRIQFIDGAEQPLFESELWEKLGQRPSSWKPKVSNPDSKYSSSVSTICSTLTKWFAGIPYFLKQLANTNWVHKGQCSKGFGHYQRQLRQRTPTRRCSSRRKWDRWNSSLNWDGWSQQEIDKNPTEREFTKGGVPDT